jgi:hypothetical protein
MAQPLMFMMLLMMMMMNKLNFSYAQILHVRVFGRSLALYRAAGAMFNAERLIETSRSEPFKD